MKELENKIREALPRLKELTDGAIVYRPHWNVFKQGYDKGVYDEIEYRFDKWFEYGEELEHFKLQSDWYIGHPIKLNDVLEYFSKDNRNKYAHFEVSKGKGYFLFFPNSIEEIKSFTWDLSSVYLADQSEELKEFLNSL